MTLIYRLLLQSHQALSLVMLLLGLYLAMSACGHGSLDDFMNN